MSILDRQLSMSFMSSHSATNYSVSDEKKPLNINTDIKTSEPYVLTPCMMVHDTGNDEQKTESKYDSFFAPIPFDDVNLNDFGMYSSNQYLHNDLDQDLYRGIDDDSTDLPLNSPPLIRQDGFIFGNPSPSHLVRSYATYRG